MALGTTASSVRGLLLRQGMVSVFCGAVPGVAAALAAGRFLQSLMTAAEPVGPGTCAEAAAVLAVVGALAVWSATGGIARLDVVDILRSE